MEGQNTLESKLRKSLLLNFPPDISNIEIGKLLLNSINDYRNSIVIVTGLWIEIEQSMQPLKYKCHPKADIVSNVFIRTTLIF